MKKIVGVLLIVLGLAFVPTVHAETKPAIAIIDTGVDTSKTSVSYEVCIMEEKRCPNKQAFMEGTGAATIIDPKNGFEHGTVMNMIAKQIDPNANIIFIRIVPTTNTGTMGIYTDSTVNSAMSWIIKNQSKFNIVAVSTSMGSHNFKTTTNYCPTTSVLKSNLTTLRTMGVMTFFAAGNNYDPVRVDYPSCLPETSAVGSVGPRGNIELYSNGGPELDFYALGTYSTPIKNAVGTSSANVALTSYWAKSYKGTYADTYTYIKSLMKPVEGNGLKSNLFVNVLG